MELVPEGMRLVRLQTPRVENAVNGVSKPNGKPDDQAFCPRGITIAELHRKYGLPCQANGDGIQRAQVDQMPPMHRSPGCCHHRFCGSSWRDKCVSFGFFNLEKH